MPTSPHARAKAAVSALARLGSARDRAGMARYGIITKKAFGVRMNAIQALAKRLGRDHALAEALWKTKWYEARTLAAFVEDPAAVTSAQMDRWSADFDNWAICDTVCFHLFDRTPQAYRKVAAWRTRRGEFQKRAAFALLSSLAGHDKMAPDAPFLTGLRYVEAASTDERNFVKKAVNWALRRIATRNSRLRAAATGVAMRLAESDDATARWIGKDALRQIKR